MEIKIKDINEVITYEKLDNGMDIYLYNKDNFHNNYVTFTTKFGSINNEFIDKETGKKITVPKGIAHFLEHKVFAQENDPQPSEFFSKNGAVSNAYTTFKNTTYLFQGTEKLNENLEYLLDFVQTPYFTEENVNKEKGIITQEINMCNDNPIDLLYEKIRSNTLHNNPFKDSIIGTVDDISSITPDLLLKCYNNFYHPSNMFLVITGQFNQEEILEIIKKNQAKKNFVKNEIKPVKLVKEPDKVVKEKEVITANTNIPKVSYNIKINYKELNIEKRKLNIYLYIIFNLIFSSTSSFDEKMKKEKIITNSLSYNLLDTDTHLILSLINETEEYEKLVKEITKAFEHIKIKEKDLERKKRVLISNEIFSFENIELINEMIVDNIIFENKIEKNIINMIRSLNLNELEEILEKINFKNKTIVIVKK